jgi:hypothetical protein
MKYLSARSSLPHISYASAGLTTFALLTAFALAYLMATQVMVQWEHRIPFPFWDMGLVVSFLDDKPSPSLLDLYWTFRDNEHRPIVSFLFYLWDRNEYDDTGELLYRAIMIANGLLATSMLGVLLVRHKLSPAVKLLFAMAVFYGFFSLLHYDNLTWQKQIHEISCLTFLSLALLAGAAVSSREDRNRRIPIDISFALLAGLGCLAATYSFGFGLTGWPPLLVNAVLMRWRRAPLAIVTVFCAFAVITYAATFVVVAYHTNPIEVAFRPLNAASYVLRVIGAPLMYMFEALVSVQIAALAAEVIAAAGLILALSRLVRMYSSDKFVSTGRLDRIVMTHAAMIMIAATGMAVMLSLGRLTVNEGVESRYVVVASLFWCALLTLIIMTGTSSRVQSTTLVFGFITLLVGIVPEKSFEDLLRTREQNMYWRGVLATQRLWPWPPNLYSVYYEPVALFRFWFRPRPPFPSFAQREPFGWIGANIGDFQPAPSSSLCMGHIDGIFEPKWAANDPDAPSSAKVAEPWKVQLFAVDGWAVILAPQSRLRWIVISDGSSVGVGVGKTGLSRPDVRAYLAATGMNQNREDQLFAGFEILTTGTAGEHVVIWGVDESGRACQIARAQLKVE